MSWSFQGPLHTRTTTGVATSHRVLDIPSLLVYTMELERSTGARRPTESWWWPRLSIEKCNVIQRQRMLTGDILSTAQLSLSLSLLIIIITISDSLGRRKWIGYLVDPSPQTPTQGYKKNKRKKIQKYLAKPHEQMRNIFYTIFFCFFFFFPICGNR